MVICLLPSSAQMRSTNRSPPKTTNIAPPCGLFGLQQCPDGNLGLSDNDAANTRSKDARWEQQMTWLHPLPRYGCSPPPAPFPGTTHFGSPALFNMTPGSWTRTGTTEGYPSYEPP